MKTEEINNLKKTLGNLTAKVKLILHEKENDPFSQRLKNFAQKLSEVSEGKVILAENKDKISLSGFPALTLSSKNHHNIHYLSIPEGHELQPFSNALTFISQGYAPCLERTKNILAKVSKPAEIMVFISPYCTNCPKVVEVVISLALSNPLITAFIIDVQYFKELADKYQIKSVPATIVDQDLVLIGHVTEGKLAELIAQRGKLHYDRERIGSLIERGLILEAADLICNGECQEAILSLFEEGDLSTRMGVLVVFEEAIEKDINRVRGMVPQLIELLSHKDSRIRGDIADLLGKIGDSRAIPHLEKLTSDPDPDVVEAASEALEMLQPD